MLGLTIGPTAAAIILTVVIPILVWPFLANEHSATPEPSPSPTAAAMLERGFLTVEIPPDGWVMP